MTITAAVASSPWAYVGHGILIALTVGMALSVLCFVDAGLDVMFEGTIALTVVAVAAGAAAGWAYGAWLYVPTDAQVNAVAVTSTGVRVTQATALDSSGAAYFADADGGAYRLASGEENTADSSAPVWHVASHWKADTVLPASQAGSTNALVSNASHALHGWTIKGDSPDNLAACNASSCYTVDVVKDSQGRVLLHVEH